MSKYPQTKTTIKAALCKMSYPVAVAALSTTHTKQCCAIDHKDIIKNSQKQDSYTQTDRQTDGWTYIKRRDTDEFSIAGVFIVMWDGPFKWKEVAMVDLDVVLSVLGDRLLLGETDTAVLQRSKYSRWNVHIITLHTNTITDKVTQTCSKSRDTSTQVQT